MRNTHAAYKALSGLARPITADTNPLITRLRAITDIDEMRLICDITGLPEPEMDGISISQWASTIALDTQLADKKSTA